MIERNDQSLQDMGARLSFFQLKLGTAVNNLATVRDEVLQDFAKIQNLRSSVDNRQKNDAEGVVQPAMFIEIVQDDFSIFTAAQFDHNPHSLTIRFIPKIRDSFDSLVTNHVRDFFDQLCLIHLIR